MLTEPEYARMEKDLKWFIEESKRSRRLHRELDKKMKLLCELQERNGELFEQRSARRELRLIEMAERRKKTDPLLELIKSRKQRDSQD